MLEFLNRFAAKHQWADSEFLSECRSLFTNTIDIVWESIGEKAFKPQTTLNAAVFDSFMVGLTRRINASAEASSERVLAVYNKLMDDEDYMRLVSRATSNERNVEARIKKAMQAFSAL